MWKEKRMPSLREFVDQTLQANSLEGNADEIIKQITEVARGRAVNGCAAISDEEVREMIINNAELSAVIAREKAEKDALEREKKELEQQLAKQKKEAEKLEKKLEKERRVSDDAEQMSLW